MNWDAISFDLDNTLLDYEEAFEKGMIYSFQHFSERIEGLNETDPYEWFFVFKKNCDDLYALVASKDCSHNEYQRMRFLKTMDYFGYKLKAEQADEFQHFFYASVPQFVEPYQGVYFVLSYLAEQQIPVGLITNGKKETQWKKIKKIGIDKWIPNDHIFISESVGASKPKSTIFEMAREGITKSSGENILHIGDSWELDVVGAIKAGMKAIYLNTRNQKPTTEDHPYKIYSSFSELKDFLLNKTVNVK